MIGRSRLRESVAANMVGIAVAAAAAALSAPLVYRWLGPGAYGLIGVYVLLQTLMPLFDLGITAGLARAVALHRGRSLGEVLTLVCAAQRPIYVAAAVFFVVALSGAAYVSKNWLAHTALPLATARTAFCWMAGALAIRLVAGLGRATLMALELQPRANAVQAMAAVLRTFGALGFSIVTGTGVVGFFLVQVPISLGELLSYRVALQRVLTVAPVLVPAGEIKRHLRFALGIAGLSAIWLMTSQVDKIMLADRLSLPGYGAYSLGVHIASVSILAVGAIHGAVLPRMTHQHAAGEEMQLSSLYGFSTSLTVATSCAVVVAIAIGGRVLVPSLRLPVDGIDPLQVGWLYAIGNAGAAVLAMAYQLQNAKGDLRVHALGTVVQAIVQVPLVAWVARDGDAVLTAGVFAVINWLFVFAWLPAVHARFLPGGHVRWLAGYLLPPLSSAIVAGVAAIAVSHTLPGGWPWGLVGTLFGAGTTFLAALLADKDARGALLSWGRTHVRRT